MYRNLRYTLDRGHPLQVPRGGRGLIWDLGLVFAVVSKYLSRRRGRGNVGILKGFPTELRMGLRPTHRDENRFEPVAFTIE